MTGIELIAKERQEQIEKHGFDKSHDAKKWNEDGELVQAASYLLAKPSFGCVNEVRVATYPQRWNDEYHDKFDAKTGIEALKVAGALIAAEIDRLQERGDDW